ncbi:hypothetical protein PILCRDRAFT_633808 [Piloderma croceum F 1598]|uniref:Uncharacterized protein n=1 Tax=Piloderma croceum (strain F 1598) TaxID=765440 RepID=A0A0C3BHN2_PILCF|nr:hypothetical protein PILCRDRAFT_633808 [Piloderma croceum F 1598]
MFESRTCRSGLCQSCCHRGKSSHPRTFTIPKTFEICILARAKHAPAFVQECLSYRSRRIGSPSPRSRISSVRNILGDVEDLHDAHRVHQEKS